MTFGRQKRLLLGLLALLAPIPLPFNEVAGWIPVLLYEAAVLVFLRRAYLDPPRWLPIWAMNLLGVLYLPILFADLFVFHRGRITQTVVQLCLFAVAVKLCALVRERDKWQVTIGIFFIFIAAMGTSVHPAILLYLVAYLVLSLVLLTRFAFLHVLAGFGREDPALARLPLRSLVVVSTLFVVVLAVPLFAVLPRVRTPFIVGRGGEGSGAVLEAAGFSDAVTLDSIGTIRNSRAVVMRIQNESGGDTGQELRFKAGTFDAYEGARWIHTPPGLPIERAVGGRFVLARDRPDRWLHVYLQPLRSRSLPLPVEASVVEPRVAQLELDRGGSVSFVAPPLEMREYRVGMAGHPIQLAEDPQARTALDLHGVTPRISRLARDLMGTGTARDRAHRLEEALMSRYHYTLDFNGRSNSDPIEDFLFRYRSGQCEYFASAMVLMLRSQGIPARLVTGFLGGEYNPFEGYYIVRDSNAHAWVEAFLGAEGWEIFDPTPPTGRPEQSQLGVGLLVQQAWDFVQFRWDRYVLSYGLYDQIQVFGQIRDLWQRMLQLLTHARPTPQPTPRPISTPVLAGAPVTAGSDPGARRWAPFAVLGLAGLLVSWIVWIRRPALTAMRAYDRVLRVLRRAGLSLPASVGPIAVRDAAIARFPTASAATATVINLYLRVSFGGETLAGPEHEALHRACGEALRELRRSS
jgi:transglutaminase-like putative cysteine protease